MKGWTVRGILQKLDGALINEGLDGLQHFEKSCRFEENNDRASTNERLLGLCRFEKSIHFREKYTMKRPQMKGWTVCGILKKLFVLKKITRRSAHK